MSQERPVQGEPMEPCQFCNSQETVLVRNDHAFAISDKNPISPGHSLIVSRRHVATIFDLDAEEYAGCFALLRDLKDVVAKEWNPQSFNIVVNCGSESGQTVFHAHVHLVPRYRAERSPRGSDSRFEK
jgi:diadenosine tetraphosphate (Ap4A) HIT family hydrolase